MPTPAFKALNDQSQGEMASDTFIQNSKGTIYPKVHWDKFLAKIDREDRIAALFNSLDAIRFIDPIKGVVSSALTQPQASDTVELTKRELEILKWLGDGKTTWETAKILNRSERVVKYHVGNIQQKLDAANRTHAVAIALRKGIIK